MIKFLLSRVVIFSWAFLISTHASAQTNCEVDNAALQAMPLIKVTLTRADGSSYSIPAKLANTNAARAAGFQRICESTIEAMPILFVFKNEFIPSFHMHNVVAPIDIAFIDKNQRLESIQAMKPYRLIQRKKPLYSSKRPVLYALEVHKGFFEKHEITINSMLSWTNVPAAE